MLQSELDFLRIEGNIGAGDLIKRELINQDDVPGVVLSKVVKTRNCIIRYLELSNI